MRVYKKIWLKTYAPVKEQKSLINVKRSKDVKSHQDLKELTAEKQKIKQRKQEKFVPESKAKREEKRDQENIENAEVELDVLPKHLLGLHMVPILVSFREFQEHMMATIIHSTSLMFNLK